MTVRVQDVLFVASGGIRAPLFEGTVNRSTARAFLGDYDEYGGSAPAGRDWKKSDTRRVAGILDLISTARKNSPTRTKSTKTAVTEKQGWELVEKIACVQSGVSEGNATSLGQDVHFILNMNKERCAADRIEGVAEALERRTSYCLRMGSGNRGQVR